MTARFHSEGDDRHSIIVTAPDNDDAFQLFASHFLIAETLRRPDGRVSSIRISPMAHVEDTQPRIHRHD